MELGKNAGTMAKAQVRHQTIVKRLLHSWQLLLATHRFSHQPAT